MIVPLSTRLLSDITQSLRAAPAPEAAFEAIVIWQRLARKFVPLIGPSSVQLIVGRSIEANQKAYPWLGLFSDPGMATPPYDGLRAVLERAEPDAIQSATAAMLMTYANQLNTLIGRRLTEQFLRATFPAVAGNRETRSKPE
jgi:hypothetical protein